ncbi:hypothetical protein [Flexivirga caeni]|uniref:hypothetical protein n=1 Tax=Flexivirga caeni TaxID=2294115 RepID=UPI000F45DEF3|nr:hypothetical protein [Flexivirga caeni]
MARHNDQTSDPARGIERLTVVRAADVAELTDLLGALVRADAALGWTAPPSASDLRGLLESLVATGPADACVVVARHTGAVAGFGYWRRHA